MMKKQITIQYKFLYNFYSLKILKTDNWKQWSYLFAFMFFGSTLFAQSGSICNDTIDLVIPTTQSGSIDFSYNINTNGGGCASSIFLQRVADNGLFGGRAQVARLNNGTSSGGTLDCIREGQYLAFRIWGSGNYEVDWEWVSAAHFADAYEPNDNPEDAYEVSLNENIEANVNYGTLQTGYDRYDSYNFVPPNDGRYFIHFDYQESGLEPTSNVPSSQRTTVGDTTYWNCLSYGDTVRINVSSANTYQCQSYSFSIEEAVNTVQLLGTTNICGNENTNPLTLNGHSGTILSWEWDRDINFSTPTTISNTTNTYTANDIATTTYFRAVLRNTNCPSFYSNIVTITQDCEKPFLTTWKTDNPGSTNATSIRIPIPFTYSNYDIDWENDGIYDDFGVTSSITHDYRVAGTYQVAIRGSFNQFQFNNSGDRQKILSIDQWGYNQWSSMSQAFYGCTYLKINATDIPNLSNVTSMGATFEDADSVNIGLENWDVSNVSSMGAVFRNASSFNGDISGWDVSNVSSMAEMFRGTSSLNQSLTNWDVSSVEDMRSMFHNATAFNGDISGWNVGKVTNMSKMFIAATAFNSDISNWDVSEVQNMSEMFRSTIIFNQDLNNWDVSSVENMWSMFYYATGFNGAISNWNTASLTNPGWMFFNAHSFNQDLSNWDISNVTSMSSLLSLTNLSIENYDNTLIGWAAQSVQPNVSLGATGLEYCNGESARNDLINNYGWTTSGDSKNCPFNCTPPVAILMEGLSTTLTNQTGLVKVQAIDFDIASYANCGISSFSFSSNPNDTEKIFDCTETGFQSVNIWITDTDGNQMQASSYLILNDDLGLCSGGSGDDCQNDLILYNGLVTALSNTNEASISIGNIVSRAEEDCSGNNDLGFVDNTSGTIINPLPLTQNNLGYTSVNVSSTVNGISYQASTFVSIQAPLTTATCIPVPIVYENLVVSLNNSGLLIISAAAFDAGSYSLCGGSIALSFSSDVNDVNTVLGCGSQGTQPIEIWITDLQTNSQNKVATFISVQDLMQSCPPLCPLTDAGDLRTVMPVSNFTICEGEQLLNIHGMEASMTPTWQEADETEPCTGAEMAILVSNQSGTIVVVSSDVLLVDFSTLSAGTYDIHSLSYADTNMPEDNITDYLNRVTGDASINDIGQIRKEDNDMSSGDIGVGPYELDLNSQDTAGNVVQIIIDAPSAAEISYASPSVCEQNGAVVFVMENYTGNVLKWQVSNSNNFSNPSDIQVTSDLLDLMYPNSSDTRYFRAVVQNGVCPSVYSDTSALTVDALSIGGTLVGGTTICGNTNSTALNLSGHTGTVLHWEKATDNTFSNPDTIPNITTSYTATNITSTTYFRAVVMNGVCTPAYSATATVSHTGNCSSPFLTTWKTDNSGTSNASSITIPTTGSGYNYDIDWENDGVYDDFGVTGDITHDYGTAGTYQVAIRGQFPRIYFNHNGDREKILSINQWGDINWMDMTYAFWGCNNLTIPAMDAPDLSSVISMESMLATTDNFNQDISHWDVSNVTNISGLFFNTKIFNQDISNWDVSKVTNMACLFNLAKSFNQNISNWDVSNVMNMACIFSGASVFNQDISSWNVSKVTNFSLAFSGAFAFNQDISSWDVSKVTNMIGMFDSTISFNQDISSWNVSKVVDMEIMFRAAFAFNQNISNWNVGKVVNMKDMFNDATMFNQNLANWDIIQVMNMQDMLTKTGLSQENYDNTLIGWATQTVQSNVPLGATNLMYCDGESARNDLINNHSWTISGDTKNCTSDCGNYANLPTPILAFKGTEDYSIGADNWTRYELEITNYIAFPNELFVIDPNSQFCGSRTNVNIFDNEDNYKNGFCAINSNAALNTIWFALPQGECPPEGVYIKMTDEDCEKDYFSNMLNLNAHGPAGCNTSTCTEDDLTILTIQEELYHAANTITSNASIAGGPTTTFKAGTSIILTSGFNAIGDFHALIEACPENNFKEVTESRKQNRVLPQIKVLNDQNLRVYPNPTNRLLTVELKSVVQANIQLMDTAGRILKSQKNIQERTEFDLSNLPAGMYFIHIVDSDSKEQVVKKIIKME